MVKISPNTSLAVLQRRKTLLLQQLNVPRNVLRASLVRQFLTCGKANCRCRRGDKHGPFHYLAQCLGTGRVQKFLLKTVDDQQEARAGIVAYQGFQAKLEELSRINTELLRRGQLGQNTPKQIVNEPNQPSETAPCAAELLQRSEASNA